MKNSKLALLVSVFPIAGCTSASAAVILTDNFTATGNPDTKALNYNLSNRQTGSSALQQWVNTPGGSENGVQVGNTTSVNQPVPTGGDYMLLAFRATAKNSLQIDSNLTGTLPLMISFDLYGGTDTATTNWVSFRLDAGDSGHPVIGASAGFGMLFRGNGGFQFFYTGGSTSDTDFNAGSAVGNNFQLIFTDTAGTGSAFNGNGSKVAVYNGGILRGTYATGQLTEEFIHFSSDNVIGGMDNLRVETIPEPSAAALSSIVAAVALLRRRRI